MLQECNSSLRQRCIVRGSHAHARQRQLRCDWRARALSQSPATRLEHGVRRESLAGKVTRSWRVFFPTDDYVRNHAKDRLKLVLNSDRHGLTRDSEDRIRADVLSVMQTYVEVDDSKPITVQLKHDTNLGSVYAVDVPVQRLRPVLPDDTNDPSGDGWQLGEVEDDADPSMRFPCGC